MKVEVRHTDVFADDGQVVDGWQVIVTYTDQEMSDLLFNYDETSGTSPSVGYCRPTVRAILDAVSGSN